MVVPLNPPPEEKPEWAQVLDEAIGTRTKTLNRQIANLKTKLKREEELNKQLRQHLKDLGAVRDAVREASYWDD